MLEKDLESKTKLLSSVKSKAMTVILDTKSLITQIQNRKATLERLKDQNQQYMELYADLAEQMKWDYNQLYGNVNDHEQAYLTAISTNLQDRCSMKCPRASECKLI